MTPAAQDRARAAAELAALVRESVTAGAARHVLHLKAGGAARPHHRRLLREALAPAMGATRTRLFELPNGDLVAIAPPPALALAAARGELARMLEASAEALLQELRLPGGAAQLLAATAESLGLGLAEPVPVPALPGPRGAAPGPAAFDAAERALAGVEMEALTRIHRVWRAEPEGAATPLWEERRVDLPGLAAALLPGLDPAAAPELLRRLEARAEARLLAEAARIPALQAWRPFGIALSPAALSGADFLRFDAALPLGRRGEVAIAFRAAEILADPASFAFARDFAAGRGYRLGLEEAPAAILPALRPALAGMELVRLRWEPALAASDPAPLRAAPGGAQLVLVGVDRPAAIAWGWEAGIHLFQGPLLDRRRPA